MLLASDFDDELIKRCQPHLEVGKYDDAVRNAFLVLETRLREATGIRGEEGPKLANRAFADDSVLVKQLNADPGTAAALRNLYAGSFGFFRNATAHHLDVYDLPECREVLTLINLLLRQVSKAQSTESALKALLEINKIPLKVQSWSLKITRDLTKTDPSIWINVGSTRFSFRTQEGSFAICYPMKKGLTEF